MPERTDARAMRQLVVNADDFGYSAGVSAGIIDAHARGIVTSTSLMVDAPAAEQAVELAREHRGLSLGLHFVAEPAVDLDDAEQLARAFSRQLRRFRELVGVDPTHVDSHHHVHAQTPSRMAKFSQLVEPLGVPLRHDGRVPYIGGFYAQSEAGVTELAHVRLPFLLELIDTEVGERFTELGCHPARITGDLSSSYLSEREVELQTLTEPGLREQIDARGVQLVSFRAWPG